MVEHSLIVKHVSINFLNFLFYISTLFYQTFFWSASIETIKTYTSSKDFQKVVVIVSYIKIMS
jgi:hypothetical protein